MIVSCKPKSIYHENCMTLLPGKKLPSSHFFTGCKGRAPVLPLKHKCIFFRWNQFLRSVLTEDKEQVFFKLLGTLSFAINIAVTRAKLGDKMGMNNHPRCQTRRDVCSLRKKAKGLRQMEASLLFSTCPC